MIKSISAYKTRSLLPEFTPYLLVLIVFAAMSNINLGKDYRQGVIEADGKGYYAYLPAVLIYQDLHFGFFYDIERVKYCNPNTYFSYLRLHGGKVINKYYAGTALCMMPFFLAGHLVTLLTDEPADGYSYYYMLFVHIGALFYLLLGLLVTGKFLETYRIVGKNIALSLSAIVLGTNLFYYTLSEFSMSHIYSFAAIAAWMLAVRSYFLETGKKNLLIIGLLSGLITLIRPVNLIIVFSVPFLSGSRERLTVGLTWLVKKPMSVLSLIAGFTLVAGIQPLIYWLQTGEAFIYSYKGEGFDFLNPHFAGFLISYRKGMFLYTPILLVCLSGFLPLFKRRRYEAIWLAVFLLVLVYMLSSWYMWYYGGSFSQRVMIEFYPFFILLLALLFQHSGQVWRKALITLTVALVLVCQVQTYQYRHQQIHWSDMTKELYWDTFLRIDKLIK